MKKQVGSPEILKKSHSHKSKKDYSRKDKATLLKQIINSFLKSFKEL